MIEVPKQAEDLPLRDCPNVDAELRTRWASKVMKYFGETKEPHLTIRSWDFIPEFDGSVQSISTPRLEGSITEGYPACFQIPTGSLNSLDLEKRSEERNDPH